VDKKLQIEAKVKYNKTDKIGCSIASTEWIILVLESRLLGVFLQRVVTEMKENRIN